MSETRTAQDTNVAALVEATKALNWSSAAACAALLVSGYPAIADAEQKTRPGVSV